MDPPYISLLSLAFRTQFEDSVIKLYMMHGGSGLRFVAQDLGAEGLGFQKEAQTWESNL